MANPQVKRPSLPSYDDISVFLLKLYAEDCDRFHKNCNTCHLFTSGLCKEAGDLVQRIKAHQS